MRKQGERRVRDLRFCRFASRLCLEMGKPFNKQYRGRGGTSYRGRGRGRGGASGGAPILATEKDGTRDSEKLEDSKQIDALDEKLGFSKYQEGPAKVGWLVNMQQVISFPPNSRDLDTQYRDYSPVDPRYRRRKCRWSSCRRFLLHSGGRRNVQEYNLLRTLFLHRLQGQSRPLTFVNRLTDAYEFVERSRGYGRGVDSEKIRRSRYQNRTMSKGGPQTGQSITPSRSVSR